MDSFLHLRMVHQEIYFGILSGRLITTAFTDFSPFCSMIFKMALLVARVFNCSNEALS